MQMQKIHYFCTQEKENNTEPDKEKDSNQGMSTIERLMKRDQTKEEKPERSRTKEGPTGGLWSTLNMFCQRSVYTC